jgi:hypothetical protein
LWTFACGCTEVAVVCRFPTIDNDNTIILERLPVVGERIAVVRDRGEQEGKTGRGCGRFRDKIPCIQAWSSPPGFLLMVFVRKVSRHN